MAKSSATFRIRLISGGIFLFALLLIMKLYFLQIVNGSDFAERADRQYVRAPQTVFNRGTIYMQSKDGNLVSGATVKTGYLIAINPKVLTDHETAYQKINAIVEIDHEDFLAKARKANDVYEEIAKKVDEEKGKEIIALEIPGVLAYQDKWRIYPGGDLAAHVFGFVGYKGDELAGRYGLERSYEEVLRRNSEETFVNFFAEMFSNIKTIAKDQPSEGDIITTIEPTVQAYLEDKVAAVNKQWKSETTGGIIINPKNGEIAAMSLVPTFDPNTFQKEKDVKVFSNFMVEDVREMGSIIKPLTVAAGLDTGVISARSTYEDTGCITLDKKTICNFDKQARGTTNMQDVLSNSLNLGVAHVANKMGKDKFTSYFKNFGLGERTGIDLPNESIGLIKNLDTNRDIEHATASFGQGIAITPMETVRALSALANGGYLISPHIVKQINYKLGHSKKIDPEKGKQVISENTSKEITRMLVEVVDKALLKGKAKNEHYSVAAKTGTAQIALPQGGGYYEDRYLHSFFGYFPAKNPQYLVFLYTVFPKDVQFASETLTTPFLETSKFLINYYNIPPDR